MSEISAADIELFRDRFLMFSELRLSHGKALQLMHQARQFVTMRTVLESMAEGGRSNADFAAWAKKILADERADRPKVKRRPKPLVRLEGVP
jgi:hypothetical protein